MAKARNGDVIDKQQVLKELHKVLKSHGIRAKISNLAFTSTSGTTCLCPDGKPGVLRVVGGELVCVCD